MQIYISHPEDGISLAAYKTHKFKSALMTVSFALELDRETASGFSLLTNLLSLSTGDYPTMQSFSIIKDELYALGLDAYVQRRGEILLVTLEISPLADSFAFDNERLLFKATELLGGAIFRPCLESGIFKEINVENEKKCLIEEIESDIENKPAYAMKRARRILCENEPYAADSAGEIEHVAALNGKELMFYYNKAINEAPVFITYVGEAEPDYLEECIKANLPFKKRSKAIPEPVVHIPRGSIERVCEKMDIGQCIVILGFSNKMTATASDRATLSVYNEIFGGSAASKLFMNVREKEGLCYYCSSYPSGRKNVLFVSCGIEAGNEEKAISSVYREIDAMKNGDFSDQEFENAKNSIIQSLNGQDDSLGSMTGYLLGQILFEDSVDNERAAELIRAVTKSDVTEFAKTVVPELEYILGGEEESGQ